MHRLRRKGWQTNGDVLRTFGFGGAVLDPLARMSNDGLAGSNIKDAASVSDPKHPFRRC